MRSFLGKTLILGVAIATSSIFGCSNPAKESAPATSENGGTVGLALQVVPGVNINSISYAITGNGVSLSGTLDVSGSSAGSSIIIGGIPAGTGYVMTLDATSVDGNLHCTGSATFDVARGTTTAISPHLQCRKGSSGGVGVSPVVNVCPTVDKLAAASTSANVGSAIALTGAASDDDHQPAALTYTWTATSGSFSDASSASPSYTCAAEGAQTLTLTVSDGDCTDTASLGVTCTAPPPPPPVTTQSILSKKSAACLACAQLNGCLDTSATCEAALGNAAAGPAAGAARAQLCIATLDCVITSGCASSGVGTPCYCGTASGTACLGAGAANGVCKTAEEDGLESTDPASVATGFGDPAKGGGVANALVQCLNDSACSDCF